MAPSRPLSHGLETAVMRRITDDAALDDREAREGLIHVSALSMTKVADGLIDPKLVLSWLMVTVGAPVPLIGALVPLREAGSLLPQMALARLVEGHATRKWFWSAGAAAQGLSALAIALAALTLEGMAAGAAILAGLTVLAMARAVCSVTQKDALARSIGKTRRGAVTGLAGSIAAAGVLGFGALLALDILPLTRTALAGAIAVAGGLWIGAALLFLSLREEVEGQGADTRDSLVAQFSALRRDRQLALFILARSLLTVTALAVPFIVMLSVADGDFRDIGELGPMVLASACASIASAYVWGRLSDRSSRWTLALAGCLGALSLAGAAVMGAVWNGLGGLWGTVCAMFFVQLAYEGVRAGRKIHLTDMTDDENRARYTAVSNTVIGVVLLGGGLFGVLADRVGPAATLGVLAALCLAAVPVVLSLDDVQS